MPRSKTIITPNATDAELGGFTSPPLRITSKRAGFIRAGIAHPSEPVDHPAGIFTEAELELLQGEPMLVVEVLGSTPAAE